VTAQPPKLSWQVLELDLEAASARITESLREATGRILRRRGLVVAISGGVDSSVCAALAVRAVGPERVFALILPERDSSSDSAPRGRQLAEYLGVTYEAHDIATTLDAIGCYARRDAAIRRVIPEYGEGWRMKIVIRGGMEGQVNHFRLKAMAPDGSVYDKLLGLREYLDVVSATNFKQRIRKTVEYFHADRLNYAVVGTPNRLEYDQGFFVKNGDGSADVKPIAHLYKTQVYALAKHLGLPESICDVSPTTDTYSLPQGQDEFYFALPYREMDLALWALNHHVPAADLARVLGVSEERADLIYKDIRNKRRTTQYLHRKPLLVEPVPEIELPAEP
jgi:NAD+ synthase